jgi:hypothetical protein
MTVGRGTIVDATIIHAPSSTKNKAGERDPEMHSTQKGNQWYFGMKAHIGVDSKSGLVHSVVSTSANVHDSQPLAELLHGNETRVWGDSAYVPSRAPGSVAGGPRPGTGAERTAPLHLRSRRWPALECRLPEVRLPAQSARDLGRVFRRPQVYHTARNARRASWRPRGAIRRASAGRQQRRASARRQVFSRGGRFLFGFRDEARGLV